MTENRNKIILSHAPAAKREGNHKDVVTGVSESGYAETAEQEKHRQNMPPRLCETQNFAT